MVTLPRRHSKPKNVCINNKATNYVRQKVMELKEVNIVSMIVENVSGTFSPIDRRIIQKTIRDRELSIIN